MWAFFKIIVVPLQHEPIQEFNNTRNIMKINIQIENSNATSTLGDIIPTFASKYIK